MFNDIFAFVLTFFSQLHTQSYTIVQRQVLSFHEVKPPPGRTMMLMGTMVTITSNITILNTATNQENIWQINQRNHKTKLYICYISFVENAIYTPNYI